MVISSLVEVGESTLQVIGVTLITLIRHYACKRTMSTKSPTLASGAFGFCIKHFRISLFKQIKLLIIFQIFLYQLASN